MKVLVFTTQFHLLSGAERLGIELALEFNRQGVHADVLSLYDDTPPGAADKARELRALGVPRVQYLGLPVNPSMVAAMRGALALRRLVREEGYDVVETAQLSPAVIAAWATLGTRARHIAGVHSVFERGPRDTPQRDAWRLTARVVRSSRYYAVSNYVADSWSRFTGLPRRSVEVIYNGIAEDAFEARPDRAAIEAELGLPSGSRIVLFVGRLDQWKGVDTALEAFGPILAQERLVLLYAGHAERDDPASREMLESAERRIVDEGWSERVRFLGRREDVFRLMASSDVLVHPTRSEAFGLVLAEAMAAGLPVVASDVDGIPEVLAETASRMIRPDDPQGLRAATLHVLARDPEERRDAAERGRRRALEFRSAHRTAAMLRFMRETAKGGQR